MGNYDGIAFVCECEVDSDLICHLEDTAGYECECSCLCYECSLFLD